MSSYSDKTNTAYRQSARRVAFIALVLGLLTLGAYWGIWRNDSVHYDDPDYIFNNEHLSDGLSWSAFVWSFTHTHVSNWHPLTWLTHALDCNLYGKNPGGHHATNLLFHIANTVLLFLGLRNLTGSIWRSALVAAFFAIHPLHVESVAWIAERKDVLSGFFFMLTLLSYAKYINQPGVQCPSACAPLQRGTRSRIWYGLTLASLACGLMSKSMLVTTPFVLLLLDVWPLKRIEISALNLQHRTLRRLVVEKIPFFLLVLASSVITFVAQGEAVATMNAIPIGFRLTNAIVSYIDYLGQTFWPVNLAVFYPLNGNTPVTRLVTALILIGIITFIVLRQVNVRQYLAVGWFWFLGMLVPVIGIVQVGSQARADRYTYLPLIGIFIAAVWGAAEKAGGQMKRGLMLVSCVLVAMLTVLTHRQVGHWQNSHTLFKHAAQVTENNYVAWGGLGIADLKQGDMDSGLTNLFHALELATLGNAANSVKFYIGVGLQMNGKGLDALPYLSESVVPLQMQPERNYRLGLSLCEANRLTEAETLLKAAVEARPNASEYQLGLAVLQYQKGQITEAEQTYRKTAKNHPDEAAVHGSLATFLSLLNRDAEAETNFAAALKLKPEDAQTRRKFARTLDRLGKTSEAISQFEEALKFRPNLGEMHFELAELLSKAGQTKLAAARYEKVIELDPKHLSALNNLAWILATDPDDKTRNGPRAIELAERACQLTEWKVAVLMGTLAAAYAEVGRFPDAVAMAEKARDTAMAGKQEDVAKRNQELADLYRTGKPFREK